MQPQEKSHSHRHAATNLKEKEKSKENIRFPLYGDSAKYERVAKIGQGTFGVFKAKEKANPKKLVAMKKVLMVNEKEGFPITTLREIKILQQLKHKNVVEICQKQIDDESCDDLAGLLSNMNVELNLPEIKKVMQQLLNGLYYIHSNKLFHRDLKTANVLITKNGVLKLADFGSAQAFSASKNGQPNRFTNHVVTLWYRAPELLLGERNYGPPVDLWGAGCIMAEMWTRSPIMPGNTDKRQLNLISQLCGSITKAVWPGVENLELYKQMELPQQYKRKVIDRLKPYMQDACACDLLDKLLVLDPSKRADADTALNHDFFWTDPMPYDLGNVLAQHSQSTGNSSSFDDLEST